MFRIRIIAFTQNLTSFDLCENLIFDVSKHISEFRNGLADIFNSNNSNNKTTRAQSLNRTMKSCQTNTAIMYVRCALLIHFNYNQLITCHFKLLSSWIAFKIQIEYAIFNRYVEWVLLSYLIQVGIICNRKLTPTHFRSKINNMFTKSQCRFPFLWTELISLPLIHPFKKIYSFCHRYLKNLSSAASRMRLCWL